jgi:hypothetical protein
MKRIVTFIDESSKVIPEQDEEFGSEISTPYAKRRKPTITIQKTDSLKLKESQNSLMSSAGH